MNGIAVLDVNFFFYNEEQPLIKLEQKKDIFPQPMPEMTGKFRVCRQQARECFMFHVKSNFKFFQL